MPLGWLCQISNKAKLTLGEYLGVGKKDCTMPGTVVGLLCVGAERVHSVQALFAWIFFSLLISTDTHASRWVEFS